MSSAPSPVSTAHLPIPRSSFVGRAAEVAAARALLLEVAVPLLTLTGPGGVGKTRLALAIAREVATEFADGEAFADLAPIRDPALVLPAIAQTVGVREEGDRPLAALLASFLRSRQFLLVLDNVEHVLASAPAIAELLAGCPALQVLATSRAPLRVRGEHLLAVPPLTLPDPNRAPPLEELARVDAVALFTQRARAADPTFALTEANAPSVIEICRRLDGLPLAIELAVARLRILSPEALLALLSDRLRVLTAGERDLPERQRTLGAAIAWSYDLLDPGAQALFRRLAVFAGGFDTEAAAAVGGVDRHAVAEPLQALADQSLLRRAPEAGAGVRFGLLETIREFALERLRERGEEAAARRAHAAYFLDLAERTEAEIYGPAMRRCLDRLEREYANLLAALSFFAEGGDATGELRLAAMVSEFWLYRGHLPEGIACLTRAITRARNAPPGVLARGLTELAILCFAVGDNERALTTSAASLPPARDAGDALRLAQALYVRALAVGATQDWDEALALLSEAREAVKGFDPPLVILPSLLAETGSVLARRGERERGIAVLEEALALHLAMGQRLGAGGALATLARLDRKSGFASRAASRSAESLRLLAEDGIVMSIRGPLMILAELVADRGWMEPTGRLLGMVEAIDERTGVDRSQALRAIAARVAPDSAGQDRVAAAVAAGRALPLSEAIAEAIAVAESLAAGTPVARAGGPGTTSRRSPRTTLGLSPREQEILAMLVARQTDKEIAEALFISPRTVMGHATSIFNKLGVANRREAAAAAVRGGLV